MKTIPRIAVNEMKVTIIINPAYEYLRGFIESLPVRFENEGETIYASRNIIKVMSADGLELNVKRYGIPAFFNRIIYSLFRTPKGKRAYIYPQRLLSKGFETPTPVAYIEQKVGGVIGHSYFISLQVPYRRKFYEFGDADVNTCRDIVIAFARYTAALHEAGIMHKDYSPGNILFDELDGVWHFSLVDINRMYFGEVSVKKGCANFARLWGQKAFFTLLAQEYAIARGADREQCVEWVLAYRKRFWKAFQRRHSFGFHLDL